MSQLSLDSLDNDSTSDDKFLTGSINNRSVTLTYDDLEPFGDHLKVNNLLFWHRTIHDNLDKDPGFNESSKFESSIRRKDSQKCFGNALIAITNDVMVKSCRSEEKFVGSSGAMSNFRSGRSAAKKFDGTRRSSSSSSSPSSLAKFRLRVSQPASGKSPDDVAGSMKAGKKLGKPRRNVVDATKKRQVSYLELHRRKFGVESRRCNVTPVGATPSICDDRTHERFGYGDDGASAAVSRDDETELGFYRRVMKLGSPEPRETRSCEASPNRHDANVETVENSRYVVHECSSNVVKSVERRGRVVYKPYTVEDYKCLIVPRPDRSLGPDRIEIASKAEWLMRRRSYGDSVSSRNRQRIHRRAQKLKDSRLHDVPKLRLPPLTDMKNPALASKVDSYEIPLPRQVDEKKAVSRMGLRENRPIRSKSVQTKMQTDARASRIEKLPSVVRGSKSALSKLNLGSELEYGCHECDEFHSDAIDDLLRLRNLQLRHLEEKKRIDNIFKRRLCA